MSVPVLNHLDVRRWSLRRRLVAGLVLLTALAIVAVGFAAVVLLRGYLIDRVDDQLARAPFRGGNPIGSPSTPPGGTSTRDLPTPINVVQVDAKGNVVNSRPATTFQDGTTPDVSSFTSERVARPRREGRHGPIDQGRLGLSRARARLWTTARRSSSPCPSRASTRPCNDWPC